MSLVRSKTTDSAWTKPDALERSLRCYTERFRALLLWFLDSFCLLLPVSRQRAGKKKLLIVRFDAIGDFVIWLDACGAFRKLYPAEEWSITLLGNQAWTNLAESTPFFDHFIPVERSSFFKAPAYRLRILSMIRQLGADVVISPVFSREFMFGDTVVRVSGAAERIGVKAASFLMEPWQQALSDRWYTKLMPVGETECMELVNNARFMRWLGVVDFRADLPKLPFGVGRPADLPFEYYVIFPGASSGMKRWPLPFFADIARRIHRQTGWTLVICGGPGEEPIGKNLKEELSDIPLLNWIGLTGLKELAATLAFAQLVVSNDTSAVHIATSVSTPSVCILGGGHFGRFLPYQIEGETDRPLPCIVSYPMECYYCDWRCFQEVDRSGAAPCISSVSVEQVWNVVKGMLDVVKYSKEGTS